MEDRQGAYRPGRAHHLPAPKRSVARAGMVGQRRPNAEAVLRYNARMPKGFVIRAGGIDRTSRDRREVALASAIYLKERNPNDVVEIIDEEAGTVSVVLPDGRLG